MRYTIFACRFLSTLPGYRVLSFPGELNMTRLNRLYPLLGLCVCLSIYVLDADSAPPANHTTAESLVQEALEREIQGDAGQRKVLLEAALKKDAEHAPARWLLGQLKYEDQWRDYREIPQLEAKRKEVQEYRKLRKQPPKSAEEHLKLADWCNINGLPLRERAHLVAALELSGDSNALKIRSRLGHQFVNGVWMTPAALEENLELADRIAKASKSWTPKLKRIARQLQSRRSDIREKAELELFAIEDPDVFPAMEAVFSQQSLQSAGLFVEFLSQMKLVEADRFLARQAVLSPFVTVREQAAKALKSRPVESYVPMMMEALRTPIQSQITLFAGQGGVRLTQRLSSEKQDVRQVLGLDSQVVLRFTRIIPVPGRELAAFLGTSWNPFRPQRDMVETEILNKQLQAHAQQRAVDLKNDELKDWNDRIFAALKIATGMDLPNAPTEWWAWWDDYNNLLSPDVKPVEYAERTDVRWITVRQPIVRRVSCLAAGSPIWTDRGYVPVEKVQVGDLVLSQHPKTGELTYKPVLKTTVRPETEIVTAELDGSKILCTKGHTFWVPGQGWQKIRELPPGGLFHTANGVARLKYLDHAKPAPTYNLVVADFHTYFAGKEMLLSHDVTFPATQNNPVPGWAE
jgi:hypothetical protein